MSDAGFTYGQVVATPAVFLIVTWLTTGMRLYVKKAIVSSITTDDWLIVIGLVIFTASCGLGMHAALVGFGKHVYALQPEQISMSLELYIIEEIMYVVNLTIVKLSIAVLLLRLTAHHVQRRIVLLVTVIFTLCSIVALILVVLQCRPLQAVWNPTAPATCLNVETAVIAIYTYGAAGAITDFIYALLPIWMIWTTNMDLRTKASVGVVLGLGMLSGCAAVARLSFFHLIYTSNDLTYTLVPMTIVDKTEVGIGIAAANLATFRPLLRILAQRSCQLMSSIGLCHSKDRDGLTTSACNDTTGIRTASYQRSGASSTLPRPFSSLSTFVSMKFDRRSSPTQPQILSLGDIEKTVEIQTETHTSQCHIALHAYSYLASWEEAWQRRFSNGDAARIDKPRADLPPRRLSEIVLPAFLRSSEEAGS